MVFDHGLESPMRFEVVAFEPAIRVMWRFVSTYDDPDNPASEWTGQTFDWRIGLWAGEVGFEVEEGVFEGGTHFGAVVSEDAEGDLVPDDLPGGMGMQEMVMSTT